MWTLALMIIAAIAIVTIGWQVWRIRPRSHNRILFFTLAGIIAAWMLLNYGSQTVSDKVTFLLLVRLVMVVTDWLPPVLFLFSRCFPSGQIKLTRAQWGALAAWTVFITFLNLTNCVFRDGYLKNGSWMPQADWGFILVMVNMLGLLSLACFNFFQKGKGARGLEKARLTYFATAFTLAMSCAVVFDLLLPAVWHISDFMNLGIIAMGLIFIGATGYSMIKTTFASIDFVLAAITYYATLLVWLAIPFGVYYFAAPYRQSALVGLEFFSYVVWTAGFVYLYNHWEKFLVKKIVNHGADWQTQQDIFLARIEDELDHNVIIDETLKFFSLLLKNTGHLVIGDFLDTGEVQTWGDLPVRQPGKLYVLSRQAWQQKHSGPFILEQLEHTRQPTLVKLHREMKHRGVAVVFPICFYETFMGVMVFGHKLNDNPYFLQDIELISETLHALAPVLSKAAIHQATEDFNRHLQRKIDRATRRLRQMNEKLVVADKLKDEFVSVASHELRTPMTAIKGYLWMVAKNNTPQNIPTNQKYIQIALNSTERLIALVNDMLTISRIEGGRFALNLEVIDARDLTRQIYAELAPIATDKHLTFTVKNPRQRLPIKADFKHSLEVLHNIAGNALKFTSQGSVTLTTRSDDKFVYIDVADTGSGIDPEDFDKLFSKFTRVEKSYVKIKETGTGLGLYISRQIMQLQHGDITFVSQPGEGSTFTLYFPRAK